MINATLNTAKIKSIKLLRKGMQDIYKIVVTDDYDTHNLKLIKQGDQYIVTNQHLSDLELSKKYNKLIQLDKYHYYVYKGTKRQIIQYVNKIVNWEHEDYAIRKLEYQVRLENSDPDEVYALNDNFYRWEINDLINSNIADPDYKKLLISEAKANRRHLSLIDGQRDWQNIPHSVACGNFFGQNYVLIDELAGAPAPSEYYYKRNHNRKIKAKA